MQDGARTVTTAICIVISISICFYPLAKFQHALCEKKMLLRGNILFHIVKHTQVSNTVWATWSPAKKNLIKIAAQSHFRSSSQGDHRFDSAEDEWSNLADVFLSPRPLSLRSAISEARESGGRWKVEWESGYFITIKQKFTFLCTFLFVASLQR